MNESWLAHNGNYRDEENLTTQPCPICGAERERRADGHLIHAVFTEETWALHVQAEARHSTIREEALGDNGLPSRKPVWGGWYS